eukprot:1679803-Pleurochrysis_carterae.AAC.1
MCDSLPSTLPRFARALTSLNKFMNVSHILIFSSYFAVPCFRAVRRTSRSVYMRFMKRSFIAVSSTKSCRFAYLQIIRTTRSTAYFLLLKNG